MAPFKSPATSAQETRKSRVLFMIRMISQYFPHQHLGPFGVPGSEQCFRPPEGVVGSLRESFFRLGPRLRCVRILFHEIQQTGLLWDDSRQLGIRRSDVVNDFEGLGIIAIIFESLGQCSQDERVDLVPLSDFGDKRQSRRDI